MTEDHTENIEMELQKENTPLKQQENTGSKQETDEAALRPPKKHRFFRELLSYAKIFLFAFILAYLLTHYIIINCYVPSGSMKDTIQLYDRIIGNRLAYVLSEPERGDIIIFPAPDDPTTIYIKRIVGLPGETIEVRDGLVYINGSDTPLDEPYLNEDYLVDAKDFGPYTIPEDSYFVLGDHRNSSYDSRYWTNTCVKSEDILGKALFIYYPFSNIQWLAHDFNY